ncbi:ABC transporter substrate-binding protein [Salipiger mucosus]|uniref:Sugar-binding protein n=1 Tax=Salipiger mucosus DSM 16094 TaxID=1123237 RepID=S9RNB6_9RHOB|nr:ABC transporter substrate-binding protein [Salipiger mucosus]EPX75474.1 Sugar-binding protein precursor [Salipiger mucosus DSM 16094]
MKLHLTTALGLTLAMTAQAQAADLRMSWWGGESRHEATQAALKVCGEKYGHTVSPEFTGFDGYLEKLTTQMAGGTEADIIQVNWPWLPLFSQDGEGFADLNTLSDTIDLSQWSEDQLAPVTVAGKLNGLPLSTTGRVFFFNVTTLEEAGIPMPSTWEEFFSAAKTLREQAGEDHNLFNSVKETAQLLVTLAVVQKTGKDLVDPETNRVAWTPEELAAGIEFYGRLMESGAVRTQQEEAGEGNVNLYEKQDWAQGKIAGSYEWDTTYFKYSDPLNEGEVLESTPHIRFEDAVTDGAYRKPSMLFAISKNSDNQQAAAEIMNCLLNEPEGIDALKDTRGLPASEAAADRLIEAGMVKPEIVKAHEIAMEATGPAISPFNEHPELRGAFIDTLEEYSYGMIDAQDAAEVIIDEANSVLEDFDA